MSLRPMYKICPKCHKTYSWNPDVGKMYCPNCMRIDVGKVGKTLWDKIFKGDAAISKMDSAIAEKDALIAELKRQLADNQER